MTASAAVPNPSVLTETIAERLLIGTDQVPSAKPPAGVRLDATLGLAVSTALVGQVLWKNRSGGLFETRGEFMPDGDLLMMFPDTLPGFKNGHYAGNGQTRANRMLALRSPDRGRSWSEPFEIMHQSYNHHGFVPLTPRGARSVIAFGTQADFSSSHVFKDGSENAPIGFRRSEDGGRTWSEPTLIRPANDPDFQGMIVVRGCETARGTWMIAPHRQVLKKPFDRSDVTCQEHILRSEDQGSTWMVLPGASGHGLTEPSMGRLEETSLIAFPDGEILGLSRTGTGVLFETRSHDDGRTWSTPVPTVLKHPYAPAMPFLLADGKTVAVFHHNGSAGSFFSQDSLAWRSQLWVSLSVDHGRTWGEPRFLLTNALAPSEGDHWRDQQCSYIDAIDRDGELHLFLPHRWRRALYLRLPTRHLAALPTARELAR